MKLPIAAGAILPLLFAVGQAGAEWVVVKETPTQTFYLDTTSRLETAPGTYRAWAKTVFRNNPAVSEKQTYEEYDCAAGTMKTLSVVVTVKNGSLVTQTPETLEQITGPGPAMAKRFLLCEAAKAPVTAPSAEKTPPESIPPTR